MVLKELLRFVKFLDHKVYLMTKVKYWGSMYFSEFLEHMKTHFKYELRRSHYRCQYINMLYSILDRYLRASFLDGHELHDGRIQDILSVLA